MIDNVLSALKKGEILGEIVYEDGKKETLSRHMGKEELEPIKNLVTQQASILLAQLAKGGCATGITHIAVGTGIGNGTESEPEEGNVHMTTLRNEIARKRVTITYNTSAEFSFPCNNGTSRTNVLDVAVEFDNSEAVGPLTEMGIFAGESATDSLNTGDLINFKVFPVWNKPDNATLKWIWRLNF